jgi:hypothetical protein
MTSLISALDAFSKIPDNMQIGENNHIEYKWSENDIQEQIMQLYFQLVRTPVSQMDTLSDKFETIGQVLETDFAVFGVNALFHVNSFNRSDSHTSHSSALFAKTVILT